MARLIVGIVGTKGSGKSTAAAHLCATHDFTKVPFAKPLKDMLRAIGLTEREVDGDLKETPSPTLMDATPRHAMQTLGTEWGRQRINPNIWLNLWTRSVKTTLASVVTDDVRYANEAALIRSLGGILIRIRRQMKPDAGDLLLTEDVAKSIGMTATHSSEIELLSIDCDFAIENTGSLGDLRAMLDAALAGRV